MEQKKTIKDVARLANVAPSTVSNVINGKPLTEKTRQRVLEAIDALGYVPNQVARNLKSQKTSIIGVVIPDNGNTFYTRFVSGIEDAASLAEYMVVMCNTNDNLQKEHQYVKKLREKAFDGLILCSSMLSEKELEDIGISVVLVDKVTDSELLTTINIDNALGGYKATEHLLLNGKRNIGIITGPLYFGHFQKRLEGYQSALNDFQIGLNYDLIQQSKPNRQGGYEAMQELYGRCPKLDAVFAENDLMAIGAMRFCIEQGISIPEKIAVVGFDNIELSDVVIPALTTIEQPQYAIGQLAMQQLLKKMNNEKPECSHTVIRPSLIERKSS